MYILYNLAFSSILGKEMSVIGASVSADGANSVGIKSFVLKNGLTIWLNEDHSQPKVFGAVVVKAGAKDCPDTGIAHYFEHMMFKGTDKIGTTDFVKEKVFLDAISEKYDELSQTENKKEREKIQKEINLLSIQAADYVVPNEFDHLISRYGGTRLNAGTSLDTTIYYNTFAPQYMEQWANLNSERLINPVFRLFQNELETVYEEKNMYSDAVGALSIEKLTERFFYPHPYAYPIIGHSRYLKNPRLSDMRKFFETYYVARNMGLILCGDFCADEVFPILDRCFSRIREGELPERNVVQLPPFQGREEVKIKYPVPFMKMMAIGFRGVSNNHADQIALNIAVSLLNNTNGTGFLDRLTVEHRVMGAMAVNESLNEAGILGIFVMPKLLFQSYDSAEELVWKEIGRLKSGDFSRDMFESLKLERKREYVSSLENISSRAQVMMRIFSQGRAWNDYLDEISRIDMLTKEDIMAVANKYFTSDYLCAIKSTGQYPKEYLPKPKYLPVKPKNTASESAYSRALEQLPVKPLQLHLIAFDKDVSCEDIAPLIKLYYKKNWINDIFTCDLAYGVGVLEEPVLKQLCSYLHLIGTENLSYVQFRSKMQALGSTLSFDVTDNDFVVRITGFDKNLEQTLQLVGLFLTEAKADDKKLSQLIDEAKVSKKAFGKSNESIAKAALEESVYGSQSRYLRELSLQEIKRMKGKDYIHVLQQILTTQCVIHYCGNVEKGTVVKDVLQYIPVSLVKKASNFPFLRKKIEPKCSKIRFFNMPDASQCIVYAYVSSLLEDEYERQMSVLFSEYFGGDMSSLMFQEIREFRSLAYQVSAKFHLPQLSGSGQKSVFVTKLSTQNDKTVEAVTVLHSLLSNMPAYPERIDAVRQNIFNKVNNGYPSFRNISRKVAECHRKGYKEDPNRILLDVSAELTMDKLYSFYKAHVFGKPIVYVVVGNRKFIDMQRLADYGKIEIIGKDEIVN